MSVPERMHTRFRIFDGPFWHDDCDHPKESFQFSFERKLYDAVTGDFWKAHHGDVYLYPGHNGGKSICIRVGKEGEYISPYYTSFLIHNKMLHGPLDFHGFTINMLILMKIFNRTPNEAFNALDTERRNINKTKLGYA